MRIITLLLFLLIVIACERQQLENEEVLSRFPSGEVRESVLVRGEVPNVSKVKSFEFYLSGQRKKEYSYQDNHFFGEWRYLYRDGKPLAEGIIVEKILDPHNGKGTATYFWPSGKKMIAIDNRPDRSLATVDYFDESGNRYTDGNIPDNVKERIVDIIFRWEKGEI